MLTKAENLRCKERARLYVYLMRTLSPSESCKRNLNELYRKDSRRYSTVQHLSRPDILSNRADKAWGSRRDATRDGVLPKRHDERTEK